MTIGEQEMPHYLPGLFFGKDLQVISVFGK
jgi:hypothetical protein